MTTSRCCVLLYYFMPAFLPLIVCTIALCPSQFDLNDEAKDGSEECLHCGQFLEKLKNRSRYLDKSHKRFVLIIISNHPGGE